MIVRLVSGSHTHPTQLGEALAVDLDTAALRRRRAALEKIGTNIHNVMIDEFQDTSRMQWGNFKLLLLEGLSQGADSLIVGDVKQSIYRWRNGDWGILNSLNNHIEHFPIRVKTLATNRRSETNVIRFNNQIFTAAANYLNGVYKQQLGKDCEDLQKAYADVVQEKE